jgi:hypothetical protein
MPWKNTVTLQRSSIEAVGSEILKCDRESAPSSQALGHPVAKSHRLSALFPTFRRNGKIGMNDQHPTLWSQLTAETECRLNRNKWDALHSGLLICKSVGGNRSRDRVN